tara:strand:- start:4508 stop:4702 length:195 start_codon:yes stop_codon:yes gene_type:complete
MLNDASFGVVAKPEEATPCLYVVVGAIKNVGEKKINEESCSNIFVVYFYEYCFSWVFKSPRPKI